MNNIGVGSGQELQARMNEEDETVTAVTARRFSVFLGVLWALLLCAPSAPAQEKEEEMLVPLTDVSTNKLPYIVAEEEGIFEKYGLNIKLYLTPHAALKGAGDGMDPNRDFVMDPETDRLLSTGGGVGLVVGRVTEGGDRVVLATTGDALNYLVYAQPGIDNLADLEGKRISASGYSSCTGSAVHMIADRMGWKVGEDITLVPNADHRVDKMLRGEYEAVMVTELPNVYAQNLGLEPVADLGAWNYPFVCSGISASESWLAQGNNRNKAKRFIKATIEAIAVMKQDRAAVYRALEKWYGVRDNEIKAQMYETVAALPKKPYPGVEGIKLIMETYDHLPEMEQHSPEDFYDASLMEEIDESGFIDNLY